jgi:monovalent cation:H+ antiporter, CPA1 family
MHDISLTVLGFMGILAFAVLMVPAAKKLSFPYTVLLALAGLLLGISNQSIQNSFNSGPIFDFVQALNSMQISSEIVFFVFLPALVFEAALGMEVRRLLDNLVPILIMAVIGLLISTFMVGYSIFAVSDLPIILCLLIGAIISATDPVAVVAIFKDVGAPKRLAVLVEGESLFNDATAIVLFTILASMLTGEGDVGVLIGTYSFIKVFFGGVLVGWLCGRVVCFIIKRLSHLPLVEISLSISLAYLSFIIAEHYLHVSGVMAVVTAALVIASRGKTIITPSEWDNLHESWSQIGFWANSIIFILVGMAVPSIMSDFNSHDFKLLTILILTAFLARALVLYLLMPLCSKYKLFEPVGKAYSAVMLWGGLRGAVSLALALAILENDKFSPVTQRYTGILVTGFVLFTLFINAPTIRFLISLFKLDQLSNINLALKQRAHSIAMAEIGQHLSESFGSTTHSSSLSKEMSQDYLKRAQISLKEEGQAYQLNDNEWAISGLRILINNEIDYYKELFDQGFVSTDTYRSFMIRMENLKDSLRQERTSDYLGESARQLRFNFKFKLAIYLQRRCNSSSLLSQLLAQRLEHLMTSARAIEHLRKKCLPSLEQIIPKSALSSVSSNLSLREKRVLSSLESLTLQYPEYAKLMEVSCVHLAAMRMELNNYEKLLNEGILSSEAYQALLNELNQKHKSAQSLPPLDLKQGPRELIPKVPLFQNIPPENLDKLASYLKPTLALPDEFLMRKGDEALSMYFISSGAVEVQVNDKTFTLGSGDFCGEIALLTSQVRNANVKASGFCDLLILSTKDFSTFMQENPHLQETIKQIAQDRLSKTHTNP